MGLSINNFSCCHNFLAAVSSDHLLVLFKIWCQFNDYGESVGTFASFPASLADSACGRGWIRYSWQNLYFTVWSFRSLSRVHLPRASTWRRSGCQWEALASSLSKYGMWVARKSCVLSGNPTCAKQMELFLWWTWQRLNIWKRLALSYTELPIIMLEEGGRLYLALGSIL